MKPCVRLLEEHVRFNKYSLVRKKGPVLLSKSQAQPSKTFSQLGNLSFAQPGEYGVQSL